MLSASPRSSKASHTNWTPEGFAPSRFVGSFDSLTLCSIRKSSIYTQEVECRRLIECSSSTLLPTHSSRGLSVEAELMNAKSGRKCKSTSYLTWLNKLYGIRSEEGSCTDELLDAAELVQKRMFRKSWLNI